MQKKKRSVARSVEEQTPVLSSGDESNVVYDTAYTARHTGDSKLYTATLMVNGRKCQGLLDTGATRTLITEDMVSGTRSSSNTLRAYGGSKIETLGVADVTISAGDKSCSCTCFVVLVGNKVLFGQDVITQLLSKADINVVKTDPIEIRVDPVARPVATHPRRHAISIRTDIEKELKRLRDRDVIESVQEATPWVSPLVPVRKSDGSLRLCVDYRQLNKWIIRERHMMPTLDEITAMLSGSTVFSVLDAESGFHQLPLSPDSRGLTTFSAHYGLFRFKRLPFGIACAPEIFQRVVSSILTGLDGVTVYIDDILIFGKNQAEHDARLKQVLQRLAHANLKLNWSKCQVRQSRVKYLGHWLGVEGIWPDEDKLKAIQDTPCPESLTDVRRFLGMATYLSKFIPQLSQATESLRHLAKQIPFTVTDQLREAFASAKLKIAQPLLKLAYFSTSISTPTAISSDASPKGLGAILWQQDEHGRWTPVTCASSSLTDAEVRYSQMEREMLGVVYAITRFRQYVLGRPFEVFTDHKPLISIVRKPFEEVPPRLQRWLVALMPYQFSITHIPGCRLVCTDALSRAPLAEKTPTPEEARSMRVCGDGDGRSTC